METETKNKPLPERIIASLINDAPWHNLVICLDSLNSIEELESIAHLLRERDTSGLLLDFYRNTLRKWGNPILLEEFRENYPRFSARWDSPEKIRILLRAADFRRVPPMLIGKVFEEVIHRHEVQGRSHLCFQDDTQSAWIRALKTICCKQIQGWTFSRIALPKFSKTGVRNGIVYIDWRQDQRYLSDYE